MKNKKSEETQSGKVLILIAVIAVLTFGLVTAMAVITFAAPESQEHQPELCPDEYRWNTSISSTGYVWDPFPDLFRSWTEVRFVNSGTGGAYSVTATISGAPVNVNIVDGDVTLGDIPAGGSAWSSDFFNLEVNMTNPQDPNEGILWRVEYDDSDGVHHVVEGVPEFCGELPQPTPTPPVPVPALTPIGLIALVGLLSVIVAMSIRRRRGEG